MKGIILSFRRGRHHQYNNQMIVLPKDINTREDAQKLIGKEVVFKTQTGKEIRGKISATHGNKGAVRVVFEKGMPGQSLNQEVEIE